MLGAPKANGAIADRAIRSRSEVSAFSRRWRPIYSLAHFKTFEIVLGVASRQKSDSGPDVYSDDRGGKI